MRFPFRFMSVLAIGLGIWIGTFGATHRSRDSLTVGITLVAAALSMCFGLYGLFRSPAQGPGRE